MSPMILRGKGEMRRTSPKPNRIVVIANRSSEPVLHRGGRFRHKEKEEEPS